MSFRDVKLDSEITSNIEGKKSLRSWIGNSGFISGVNYNCSTSSCQNLLKKGEVINSFELRNESIVGFVVEGRSFIGLDSLSFKVNGNSEPSCVPPLVIEFASDEDLILTSSSYIDEPCFNPNYGCFNPNVSVSSAEIPSDGQYCEKIRLLPAPAYKLGAGVSYNGGANAQLVMKLYGVDASLLGECNLPNVSSSGQNVNCILPYSGFEEKDYFVCIKAKSASRYTIRTEGSGACGTVNFGETYPRDYEIYAQGLKFASASINVNESSFLSSTGFGLKGKVEEYIERNYGDNCEPYCIIPFKIRGQEQDVSFNSVESSYDIDGALNIRTGEIYSVMKDSVLFNANSLNLDLSKLGFKIPLGKETKNFILFIDGQKVLNESITVSPSFDFSLGPSIARIGINTRFGISTNRNLTSVKWDFGDGGVVNSVGKNAVHRYTQTGIFNLSVEVSDSSGASSRKTIQVRVGEAKESANLTIEDYRQRVNSFNQKIASYPPWVQTKIKAVVDVENNAAVVESLARAYLSAENETDYVNIINNLLAIKIPRELVSAKKGVLPLISGIEGLDKSLAEQLTGTTIPDEFAFVSNLAFWTSENYNAEIQYENINAIYDVDSEPFFSLFKVSPRAIGEIGEDYFVIGYDAAAIKSNEGYDERVLNGGVAYRISGNIDYEFLILDSISPSDIGAFISPIDIDALLVSDSVPMCRLDGFCDVNSLESVESCPQDCKSNAKFYVGTSLFLLGLLGIVLGILWWWYRTRYERSLFPNKNDLANLIFYIRGQKKTGFSDKQIRERLKKANWTGEQINYALNKIEKETKKVEKK
ncbi:MAG: PKD domain-containing protein [Nanoarchaeota archaeon]